MWHKIEELARQNPQVPLARLRPPGASVFARQRSVFVFPFLQSSKLRPGLHPQEEVSSRRSVLHCGSGRFQVLTRVCLCSTCCTLTAPL